MRVTRNHRMVLYCMVGVVVVGGAAILLSLAPPEPDDPMKGGGRGSVAEAPDDVSPDPGEIVTSPFRPTGDGSSAAYVEGWIESEGTPRAGVQIKLIDVDSAAMQMRDMARTLSGADGRFRLGPVEVPGGSREVMLWASHFAG